MNDQLIYELRSPESVSQERNIQLFSYCMVWEVTNKICCLSFWNWKRPVCFNYKSVH